MTARDDDYEYSWNRDADDKEQRDDSPVPTGRDEPIASVAEANKPQSSPRSESPYSNDFEDDGENEQREKSNLYVANDVASVEEEETIRTKPARTYQEPNDSAARPSKQENSSRSSNHSNDNYRHSKDIEKRSQQSSVNMRRSKSSIYDTRYAKFAPNHSREMSELELQEQSERLSVPKRHKQRELPPVQAGAKTYKGHGMKSAQIEEMLDRLTQRKKPATDSQRTIPSIISDKCGIMNSFQWNGRW